VFILALMLGFTVLLGFVMYNVFV